MNRSRSTTPTSVLTRKQFCAALCALPLLHTLPARAQAGNWPQRPIRLVVPFAPGGNTDVIARLTAQHLAQQLGQPVVVENIPGANGAIGASRVASATADGYTLLFGTAGTQAINLSLYSHLGEKNLDDFEYIALLSSVPNVLVINPKLPVNNVAELVEYARRQPNGLNYGSPGSGSSIHLSGEMFKLATHTDLTHVPYKGSAPALTDLMGGQLDFIFENITPAMPFIQSGRLKALAVTSAERNPLLPALPTMKESGYTDFVTGTWNGVLAPRGTPTAIVEQLTAAALQTAASPDFSSKVAALGAETRQGDSAAFRAFTLQEYRHWHALILAAGIAQV